MSGADSILWGVVSTALLAQKHCPRGMGRKGRCHILSRTELSKDHTTSNRSIPGKTQAPSIDLEQQQKLPGRVPWEIRVDTGLADMALGPDLTLSLFLYPSPIAFSSISALARVTMSEGRTLDSDSTQAICPLLHNSLGHLLWVLMRWELKLCLS